ncbi:3-hydroxybenzoate 6-hydroxylase 1 [Ascidiaceihabitans donghaensis]|uniref:3-hydroxybenzoate 6-hydroxylase 1 n=1 Tax=Ascidiaceihabitans donghaensis TaxID=1510460 RepID=A0A2R8BEV8_9RHOB|nr:FAD-dependent monooxygenase [Ascidiaceihabitans donghaensis]SPH21630.1 3-hydroxybenzoate 6-hydroxylase 1 [Ascidiaceihabitans donghaensis]
MLRNVIVVGGGIAGLAAATLLGRAGASVTLLERAPALREVGAGIQISPNGLTVLRAMGLETPLQQSGAVQAQAVCLCDYKRPGEVARLDLTRLGNDQKYYFVHRADVLTVLVNAARQAGVQIMTNMAVKAISSGAPASVDLMDGTCLRAELVVAADGVHSVGRSGLNPTSDPFFTGQVAWRAMVENMHDVPSEARVFMGPGRHIVSYPLRHGKLVNIVAVEERDTWVAEGWDHVGDADVLRARFADFEGPSAALLDAVGDVSVWGLHRHPIAKTWYNEGVVLVGDAAHPTLPFLAQGANMALEDVWVLAQCLKNKGLDGLQAYQDVRMARVPRVLKVADGNARNYHLRPGPMRSVAHLGLKTLSNLAPGVMLGKFDWLYRHDVTAPR